MIDIKEVAKTMTREEFLTQACQIDLGILDQNSDCPHSYKLKSFKRTSQCLGNDLTRCRECWEEATNNIQFKKDMGVKSNE